MDPNSPNQQPPAGREPDPQADPESELDTDGETETDDETESEEEEVEYEEIEVQPVPIVPLPPQVSLRNVPVVDYLNPDTSTPPEPPEPPSRATILGGKIVAVCVAIIGLASIAAVIYLTWWVVRKIIIP